MRENLVFNYQLEPVKRYESRRSVMKFRNFGDSASSGMLQTLSLSRRKIQQRRIATVDFRMNEISSNNTDCNIVNIFVESHKYDKSNTALA
jgi:hypothetical protein